jgi:dephospho-CoA kinase
MSTDPARGSAERPRRARAGDGLWIVGVVGRAGSGKSTVARTLAADGAPLIEADRIGHQVTDHDPEVRAALIAEYGDDVYRPDGALDRARVGRRVFADRAALERLNRLVHPRIVRAMRAEIAALSARGYRGPVVVDAALMLDWGFERECDAIFAVTAPEALQVERLIAARGWSEDQARARLAAQRPNEAFAAAADVVLENHGSLGDLERRAREAMRRRPHV